MVLYACLLSFLSVSLFVYLALAGRDRAGRRRVEKELIARALANTQAAEQIDDAALLRDESLSGFSAVDRFLNSLRLAANMRKLIEQADVKVRVAPLIMMMLALGALGLIGAKAIHLDWWVGIVIGLLLGSAPYTWVLVCRRRRFRRFEAQFPEAVDLMSRAIRAGHAFSTGIKMVADEMPDPVGREFRRVFEEQNLGLPLRSALMGLLGRIELVDLKLFVVAVLIQRQSGGNLSEILDKIAYTIRERFRILRQLKVHTAQARLTGIILTCLPPVVGFAVYLLNRDFFKIMATPWGIRLIVMAGVLQIMGGLWIRKIVNIEV